MNLLNEEQSNEKQGSKNKKIILVLLIICVIALITILCLMAYLKTKTTEQSKFIVNGKEEALIEGLIINDANGMEYISLRDLAYKVGYEYYSNEYPKAGEDTSKCYIKNDKLITSFEMGTNEIYKYEEGTNLDYQYENLSNNIIIYNNKLYIALVDLRAALNIRCSKNDKITNIQTMEYIIEQKEKDLEENGYKLTEDINNRKAVSYGWLIVKKNDLWKVLDLNYNEIIGSKYSSIYFDEKNMNYIVSNSNGRYGIISAQDGSIEIPIKYDGLEILNYENMLYKVQSNSKYGIIDKDGNILADIKYDEIGYKADEKNKIQYTLIIPELDGKSGETIVVKENNKYGLIYLKNGEEFIPCNELDAIYGVNELEETKYKMQIDKKEYDLIDYIDWFNTSVTPLN